MIAERRGAVEPHALVGDIIDFAGRLPEVGFQRRPIGVVQPAQDDAQAVVGKLDRTQRLADESFQGMRMVACPVLHADLTVIRLGQQEGQPHGGQPTIRQAPVQMMRAEVPLQEVRKL